MLLVHIEHPSPRARFALDHVLRNMIGWDVRFTGSMEEFRSADAPKIHYGRAIVDERAFHLHASGWLEEEGVRPFEPRIGKSDGIPVLFPNYHGHDPFAGTFYLISRYEEYLEDDRDAHGRLPSGSHFMVKHGIERIPVVDHWALQLADQLRSDFPALREPSRRYRHVATIDVDNGLKYRGRPKWRQFAALLRDLLKFDLAEVKARIAVMTGKRKDPFAVLEEMLQIAAPFTSGSIAFFLTKGGGKFDHAADPLHPAMRNAIGAFASTARIGIHPSYESSRRPAMIGEEIELLSGIAGIPITTSRQHFLRWKMPDTLRELEQAGIRQEHSIGFSDRSGFRAGTCTPFPWYDLHQERVSAITMHPFATMDSAFYDQQKRSPHEASAEMISMAEKVRAVNGNYISVWHDRFLSGSGQWRGWPEVFREVIEKAAP